MPRGDRAPGDRARERGGRRDARPEHRTPRSGGPWRRLPAYPAFLALFPVLSLAAHNAADVPFRDWVVPALLAAAAAGLAVAVLAAIVREPGKAGFVAAVGAVLVLYYGQAVELLPAARLPVPVLETADGVAFGVEALVLRPPHFVWIGDRASEFDLFFVPLWMSAGAAALVAGLRRPRDWSTSLPALNLAGLFLVGMPAWGLARHAAEAGGAGTEWRPEPVPAVTPVGPARDIYYLVFDRYGSAPVLAEFFGFDNGGFTAALRARGFYVADGSRSNYPQTMHSLASSLNFEFLDGASEEMRRAPGLEPMLARMENHRVGAMLRRAGYRYLHGGAWWTHTRRNPNADESFEASLASEFAGELVDRTLPARAFVAFGGSGRPGGALAAAGTSRLARWEFLRAKLAWLAEIPDRPEPTFTLAHFLTPHNPYIVDREGRFVPLSEELRRTRRENYLEQVRFLNREILRLVDTILARSDPAPIIVLQADEGPYPDRFYADQGGPTKWLEATPEELRMKLGILNAYHLPGRDVRALHPAITPVNTFRIVFDEYFGTDYGLLPDRSWVFSGDFHRFWDVTGTVRAVAR